MFWADFHPLTGEHDAEFPNGIFAGWRWFTHESRDLMPYSHHAYAYAQSDPVNYVDPTGQFRCAAAIQMSTSSPRGFPGGPTFTDQYAQLCLKSDMIANMWRETGSRLDAVATLMSLFAANGFPGGNTGMALELRQRGTTPAAERLEFILDYAESLILPAPVGQTAANFGQAGFNSQFQDSWPNSSNQVGHFLTAAGLGYGSSDYINDIRTIAGLRAMGVVVNVFNPDYEALRLIVGHELVGDSQSLWTALPITMLQYSAATPESIDLFLKAVNADIVGDQKLRDCYLQSIVPDLPIAIDQAYMRSHPERYGNSMQDLRLSVKGWIFGQMIKRREIIELRDAYLWLKSNLK